jgi:hypothetical protein
MYWSIAADAFERRPRLISICGAWYSWDIAEGQWRVNNED